MIQTKSENTTYWTMLQNESINSTTTTTAAKKHTKTENYINQVTYKY